MAERLIRKPTLHRVVKHNGIAYIGGIVAGDESLDMEAQTRQVLAKLDAYLEEAGSHRTNLLSATNFITDMSVKPQMDAVWKEWFSDGTLYGFKYVSGHPKNSHEGRQTVTAFGVLSDVGSGYPLLLSEMTILTALRTAATSALAAKYLARPNSRTMAIIGNGAQSEFQARAFRALLGIWELRLYDIDGAATRKCTNNLTGLGFTIAQCTSVADAVEGADIITTVTADKRRATILSDNHAGPGVHINAVGGDCPSKTEISRDVLLRSDIFVEYPLQTRIEGDIQQLPETHPITELWQVISGQIAGRSRDSQITLFDSVSFAIEDFSALRCVRGKIGELGLFAELDLLADPDEPRDLYGMLLRCEKNLRVA